MNIPIDKQKHFFLSFIIAVVLATILANALYMPIPAASTRAAVGYAAAFLLTLSVGIAKELRDRRQPGNHFCWRDLAADALGAALGSCFAFATCLI